MSDTTYSVVLKLSTEGTFGGVQNSIKGIGESANAVKSLGVNIKSVGESIGSVGEQVGGFLSDLADRAISLTAHFVELGAAAALGVAAYGVGVLNRELEETKLSLGAIGAAEGLSPNFAVGFERAGGQLEKMKQDVKTLPGDVGQLATIMTTIATSAAQAGANMDQIRTLAGRTMLVGTILKLPPELASRQMAQLLSGHAGAQNRLANKLGIDTKTFDKLGPEQRLKLVNQELAKYNGAAAAFGKSFIGVWTTLKDNVKYSLISPATAPLFDHVKNTIKDINAYFETHKGHIEVMVRLVGIRLAEAWDWVVQKMKSMGPTIDKLLDLIVHMKPGEGLKKLEHVAAMLLELKVAGVAIKTVSSAAAPIASIANYMAMKKMGQAAAGTVAKAAGGAGLAEAAGAGVGAAGAGEAVAGVGSAVGGLGAASLIAIPLAIAVAAGVGAVAGQMSALGDVSSRYHADAVKASADLALAMEHLRETAAPATNAVKDFAESMGTKFVSGMALAIEAASQFFQGWHALVKKYVYQSDKPFDNSGALPAEDPNAIALGSTGLSRLGEGGGKRWTPGYNSAEDIRLKHQRDGAGITIQKVEIVVSGNTDPSRVARLTVEQLANLARNPTKSPYVPHFDR